MRNLFKDKSSDEETKDVIYIAKKEVKSSAVSSIIRKFELDEYSNNDQTNEHFNFSIATKEKDRKACYKLVSQAYYQKGFLIEDDYKLVISQYDDQKSTLVVTAKDDNDLVIATVTIILNVADLPCFKAFPKETDKLKDRTLAEVTRLAIHDDYRQSKDLLKGLFNYVYVYAYKVFDCDHTLIEVNPNHVQYYKRFLYFKPISSQKECTRVQGAPAILSSLDWTMLNQIEFYPHEIKNLKRSIYKDLKSNKEQMDAIQESIILATRQVAPKQINYKTVIKQFCDIVGPENVKEDLDTRLEYSRSTLQAGTTPKLIIQPKNQEEVKQVLALSNQIKWEVHPISTGKNWGYSDACAINDGVILLDLKRMNKILSCDSDLGTIVVEPGVTQGQVAKYLEDNNIPFMMDATGAGPDTSLIGNTAERGFGHSPNGDRFANSCGYEVILANGDVLNTGFGNFENSKVTDVFKWGVGPSLDGLFTQSNLGVITKMTFWMVPKPECFKVAYFILKENSDISEFIDILRPLRMDGTLKSVIHIGNDLRMISMAQSYPWEEMKGVTPLSNSLKNKLIKRNGLGAWSGSAGLYGSKEQVKADINKIKKSLKHFKGLKKLIILGEKQVKVITNIGEKIKNVSFGKKLYAMSEKIKITFDLLKGQSPETCVQGGLWRVKKKHNNSQINSTNPLDHNAGFYWISPVIPMKGSHVMALQNLVEPIFNSYGFDLQQTLSMTNERSLSSVMTISFDKSHKKESMDAKQCHDQVLDALNNAGYIIYRAGNHSMKKLNSRDKTYLSALAAIKNALDPNNILSPGKYNM